MVRTLLASFALLVATHSAIAQPAEPTQPLLTKELLGQIRKDADTLTEADVLKCLPTAYRLAPATDVPESDWVIICAETTEFVIELTDGKLSSRSATFHPAAKSKDLTLQRFRELKDGMTKEEIERLIGQELHRNGNVPTQNGGMCAAVN